MLTAGLQPNLVTYNTLLEVYAKRGMWREAVGVLDTLEQQVSTGLCFAPVACLLCCTCPATL
jgi:pentatricopeptide repeat protein